jgi:hypothetical protein
MNWKDCGKLLKYLVWIVDLGAEIWTEGLLNMKQEW